MIKAEHKDRLSLEAKIHSHRQLTEFSIAV